MDWDQFMYKVAKIIDVEYDDWKRYKQFSYMKSMINAEIFRFLQLLQWLRRERPYHH